MEKIFLFDRSSLYSERKIDEINHALESGGRVKLISENQNKDYPYTIVVVEFNKNNI